MAESFVYIGAFVILLLIAFGIFLLLREFNCWYYKINARLKLMEEQNAQLNKVIAQLEKLIAQKN